MTIIPTGVDISRFENSTPVSRADIGVSNEDIVFISIAHLVAIKGYEELIEAVAALKNEFNNLKIICVGKGEPEYENYLKKLMKEKGVTSHFLFAGNTNNVAGWLKAADVKILATQNHGRREAFGAALVEAMAAGLPVLATRSGGPEDIVVDGETGWMVDGDGITSLVEGIRTCMKQRNLWKIMGEKGKLRAKQFYKESRMIESYSSVYMNVIKSVRI
jgi:glycosyltransferase involved in cell wall biosynthesis